MGRLGCSHLERVLVDVRRWGMCARSSVPSGGVRCLDTLIYRLLIPLGYGLGQCEHGDMDGLSLGGPRFLRDLPHFKLVPS